MIHLLIIGDLLLDKEIRGSVRRLAPDAPVPVVEDADARVRPGGAGLAALLAAGDGARVKLLTAIAGDTAGTALKKMLDSAGVDVVDIGLVGSTPQKIRIGTGDRSLVRLDLGEGRVRPDVSLEEVAPHVRGADAVLISDYGRGVAGAEGVRAALAREVHSVPIVWDPHPNGPPPVPNVRLATPNEHEVERFAGHHAGEVVRLAATIEELRNRWGCAALSVTRGQKGALLVQGSTTPSVVPAPAVAGGDVCGAGDRFATTAALQLARGALVSEAVSAAVEDASRFVARGGASAMPMPRTTELGDFESSAPSTETRTVVATGGCFDILHAGHVALLQAAAQLGDRLVVLMNSDASVRRLKGPGRPLVPAEDREAVLRSIVGVDEVVVFDEDTPEKVLERLRPDLFVKGGDYAGAQLPEAEVVTRWGGRTVVLPYLKGRSTSALVKEAIKRARL